MVWVAQRAAFINATWIAGDCHLVIIEVLPCRSLTTPNLLAERVGAEAVRFKKRRDRRIDH